MNCRASMAFNTSPTLIHLAALTRHPRLCSERRLPFSPDDVAKEFADAIKSYGIASAHSHCYGGMWPREWMAVHGVDVMNAILTTRTCI
jgi:hypothetical protein